MSDLLHFEDFAQGQTWDLGERALSRSEIVDFAREWDPQPFHVDEDAASEGPFSGLVASGWHTAVLAMRMYVDGVLVRAVSLGSPGVEELRWHKPVRPDVPLRARVIVEETRPSTRRPDRGTVTLRWEVRDAEGELVMTMRGHGLFARRVGASAS